MDRTGLRWISSGCSRERYGNIYDFMPNRQGPLSCTSRLPTILQTLIQDRIRYRHWMPASTNATSSKLTSIRRGGSARLTRIAGASTSRGAECAWSSDQGSTGIFRRRKQCSSITTATSRTTRACSPPPASGSSGPTISPMRWTCSSSAPAPPACCSPRNFRCIPRCTRASSSAAAAGSRSAMPTASRRARSRRSRHSASPSGCSPRRTASPRCSSGAPIRPTAAASTAPTGRSTPRRSRTRRSASSRTWSATRLACRTTSPSSPRTRPAD